MEPTNPARVVVLPKLRLPGAAELSQVVHRGRHALAGLIALSIGVGLLGGPLAGSASATPASTPFATATTAKLADVALLGGVLTAGVGVSSGTSASTATNRSDATVSTLGVGAVGLTVPVATTEQHGDNAAATSQTLADVGAGVLTLGALSTSAWSRWPGDQVCVPVGASTLSQTSASTAGLAVPALSLTVAGSSAGAAFGTGTRTSLTAGSDASHRGATSTTTTTGAKVKVGNITIDVPAATLVAQANGVTGAATTTATLGSVTVTAPQLVGAPVVKILAPGQAYTSGLVSISSGQATATKSADGTSAGVSSPGLLSITVAAVGSITLFPVSASASVPVGGVDCVLPKPVITTPLTGALLGSRTVTVAGTGVAGSTVTLTAGSATATAVVNAQGQWSTPLVLAADGPATVTATQTAEGYTSGVSTAVQVTVDTTAPGDPTITTPVGTTPVRTPVVTLNGTAEPGSAVTLTRAGGTFGPVTARTDGTWTAMVPLVEGPNSFTAKATDAAGNVSRASAPWTVTLDSAAPAVPVITAPAAGAQPTTLRRPVVSGTAEPLSTIEVTTAAGTSLGTTAVTSGGTWSLTPTVDLAEGANQLVATSTDAAGNASASAPRTVTVDTTAPAAPVITSPVDQSSAGAAPSLVGGTGERGATVTVTVDGATLGTAVVDNANQWTVTGTLPAGVGPHQVRATQVDVATNASPVSATVHYSVLAPVSVVAAPVVTPPTGTSLGARNTVGGTVTGALPGDTVVITLTPSSGAATVLPATAVGADGTFSATTDLADGTWTITAVRTSGGVASDVSAPVRLVVDATPPAKPVLTGPDANVDTATPVVTGTAEPGVRVDVRSGTATYSGYADADGAFSIVVGPLAEGRNVLTVNAVDAFDRNSDAATRPVVVDSTPPAAVTVTAPAAGTTKVAATTVTGTGAEPGATVTVWDEAGAVVGTALAGADGTWALPGKTFPDGSHTLTVTQTDRFDRVSAPTWVTFTVDTAPPAALSVSSPAGHVDVKDQLPVVAGAGAESGSTVKLLAGDGSVLATVPAGTDGTFSLPVTPVTEAEGPLVRTVVQVDAAGNVSAPVQLDVSVDRSAAAPVVTTPTGGSTTGDPRPVVSGTAEPLGTVLITVDGASLPLTPVDATGHWSRAPFTGLSEGVHTLQAVQTDALGNVSPASAPLTFTVDLSAAPPVVDALVGVAGDNRVTVTGHGAEPGASVTVSGGVPLTTPQVLGTGTALADGTWSVEIPAQGPLTTYSATQTDVHGNTSSPSGAVALNLGGPATTTTTTTSSPSTSPTSNPTTSNPTTSNPTTSNPTTSNPTTSNPTTSNPTTSNPTTSAPTTSAPTTSNPTTSAPTTSNPTTSNPTTSAPTTSVPTTSVPTTSVPTTSVPTTSVPTTSVPTTSDPTTSVPTTSVPTTSVPTTSVPTTSVPTTSAPTTSNPTTSVPTTATVPTGPVIAFPGNGYTSAQGNQVVRGTAKPGSRVIIRDGSTVVGTLLTDANGNWSIAPVTPFATGQHSIVAVQEVDGEPTQTSTVKVWTVAPSVGIKPDIMFPVDGTVTPNRRPMFSGTGAAGSTVTLRSSDGTVIGTATAATSPSDPTIGVWKIFPSTDLPVGSVVATATQVNANGTFLSNTITVTIDPTAPAPVAISTPIDFAISQGGIETVVGTGEPGGRVTLYTNTAQDSSLANLPVAEDGTWTAPDVDFGEGVHWVVATQSIAWAPGQLSKVYGPGATVRTFSLNSAPVSSFSLLAAPASMTVNSTSQTVRVIRIASTDGFAAKVAILSPAEGDVTTNRRPTISGTGEPGATIVLKNSAGTVIGSTVVSAGGTWNFTPTTDLPYGTERIVAVQTTVDGTSTTTSDVRGFVISAPTTATPAPVTAPAPGAGSTGTGSTGTGSAGTGSAGTGSTGSGLNGNAGTGSASTGSAGTGSASTGRASTGSAATGSASTGLASGASTVATVKRLARTGADLAPLTLGIALVVGGLGAILAARRGRGATTGEGRATGVVATGDGPGADHDDPTVSTGRTASTGRAVTTDRRGSAEGSGRAGRPVSGASAGVAVLDRPRGAVVERDRAVGAPRWSAPDGLAGMPLLEPARTSGRPARASGGRPPGVGRPQDRLPGKRSGATRGGSRSRR